MLFSKPEMPLNESLTTKVNEFKTMRGGFGASIFSSLT